MKTLNSYITRPNALIAIVLIACINLYLSITYPLYALFVAACFMIVLVGLNTKKINGIYYFLHMDKYRIAFIPPSIMRGNYKMRRWFFYCWIQRYKHFPNIELWQLYILGFGFGIRINK